MGLVVVAAITVLAAGCRSAGDAAPPVAATPRPAVADEPAPAPLPVAAQPRCEERAAALGLVHVNQYGPVVAASPNGIIMQRNFGQGAAVGDYDGDGDLDVYLLAQAGQPSRLYRNELRGGRLRFAEVARAAGVADTGLGRVAHFADLDGDGDLDLLVVNDRDRRGRLGSSRLYRNDGDGRFSDVTAESGFAPVGYIVGGAALADVDADGDLDLYLAYWAHELGGSPHGGAVAGDFPGHNRLYENTGALTFRDATASAGLGRLAIDSMTPVLFDFDRDGDPDLYQAVDHRADRYYENLGGGRFAERSQRAGVLHRGNDMGAALADIDGNGYFDLFVSNIFDPQQAFGVAPPGNTLLVQDRNADGSITFRDQARARGVLASGWGWGAAFVDLDADGDEDLYVGQGFDEFVGPGRDLFDARSTLFTNDGSGRFSPMEGSGCSLAGDQRAVVVFDANRDGAPDLLLTQVAGPVQLLLNRTAGSWLTVALDGDDAMAAGAVVEARTADRVMRRAVIAGGSYLSGTAREAYFGLAGAAGARVSVTWADGSRQDRGWAPAGSVVRVMARRSVAGR